MDVREQKLLRGLRVHPRIGDGVYLVDTELFRDLIANALATRGKLTLDIGRLNAGTGANLRLQPERC